MSQKKNPIDHKSKQVITREMIILLRSMESEIFFFHQIYKMLCPVSGFCILCHIMHEIIYLAKNFLYYMPKLKVFSLNRDFHAAYLSPFRNKYAYVCYVQALKKR